MAFKILIILYMGIFCPLGLKFFMVTQETIIYRPVMRSHDFYGGFKILILAENGPGR